MTKIRVRAERRAGELLAEMEKPHGARGHAGPGRGHKTASPKSDPVLPTLKALGISRDQSSAWRGGC